jgi:membrane-associated HD superfamily phosphohydrolase
MNEEVIFGSIVYSFVSGISISRFIHKKLRLFVLFYTLLNMLCFHIFKRYMYYIYPGNIFLCFLVIFWFCSTRKTFMKFDLAKHMVLFVLLIIPYLSVFFVAPNIKWENCCPIYATFYICLICLIIFHDGFFVKYIMNKNETSQRSLDS